MVLDLVKDIEKLSDNFREWIINNSGPALMIFIFIFGLIVFFVAYNALHKNN